MGDELDGRGDPEVVRTGWHTTMIGRKLDQGILVRVVIEDTSIHAIHHLKPKKPASTSREGSQRSLKCRSPGDRQPGSRGRVADPARRGLAGELRRVHRRRQDGKAIVKERLAMIEANQAAGRGSGDAWRPPTGSLPFPSPSSCRLLCSLPHPRSGDGTQCGSCRCQ